MALDGFEQQLSELRLEGLRAAAAARGPPASASRGGPAAGAGSAERLSGIGTAETTCAESPQVAATSVSSCWDASYDSGSFRIASSSGGGPYGGGGWKGARGPALAEPPAQDPSGGSAAAPAASGRLLLPQPRQQGQPGSASSVEEAAPPGSTPHRLQAWASPSPSATSGDIVAGSGHATGSGQRSAPSSVGRIPQEARQGAAKAPQPSHGTTVAPCRLGFSEAVGPSHSSEPMSGEAPLNMDVHSSLSAILKSTNRGGAAVATLAEWLADASSSAGAEQGASRLPTRELIRAAARELVTLSGKEAGSEMDLSQERASCLQVPCRSV